MTHEDKAKITQHLIDKMYQVLAVAEHNGLTFADEIKDAISAAETTHEYLIEGPEIKTPRYIDPAPLYEANAAIERIKGMAA